MNGCVFTHCPAGETLPADLNESAWRRIAGSALLGGAAAAGIVILALVAGGRAYVTRPASTVVRSAAPAPERDQRAARRLASLRPSGVHLVIDTARNRFGVYSGTTLLRQLNCSTGTGMVLRDPRDGRSWTFDTPLGERRVLGKRRDPVWTKPDWAFIEEGFLPSDDPRHRRDEVSLGAYALDLGDGYLIHGTLFQRLLGRPVTHGCVRLGDEDLEYVYRTVPLGAPVYLF